MATERGDKTDFEYHTLIPNNPVISFSYNCDSVFDTTTAYSLSEQKDAYALIVLDLKEACWGIVDGNAVSVMGTYDSIVPNKHGQGGQSQHRFDQLREIAINEYFIKLAERANTSFLNKSLKGILIGGCGMTKDEFVKGNYLHHELRKIVIGTFDTGYTNEYGLLELIEASNEHLISINLLAEKTLFDEFLKELARETGKVAYGEEEVMNKAMHGQVKKLIISTSQLNKLEGINKNNSTNYNVVTISKDSDSGKVLDQAFGGFVAMLRYG